MSYLEYQVKYVPTGLRKLLYLNWPLVILVTAVACIGFLMLYSVAGGDLGRWAEPQIQRFGLGMAAMLFVAMIPIYVWRNLAALAYLASVILLVLVEFIGETGMGAQRWIDLGFMRLQPSELMKITLVMLLAAYYDWLPMTKVSRPLWVAVPLILILMPTYLVLRQPDLGTSLLLVMGGGTMMFLAGVHWAYFGSVVAAGIGTIIAVFESRGTPWQLLADYQYRRIDTFLDPTVDPTGAGYHITQAKIALGSGGWTGRLHAGDPVAAELPAREAHRLHLHHPGGRVRLRRRDHPADPLRPHHLLLRRLGPPEQGPVLLARDPRRGGDLLPVLRGEHGDGHGPGPGRRRAPAAGQLRRLGHAGAARRLRAGAIRPCPQAKIGGAMINVLFAGGSARWDNYAKVLPAAIAAAGIEARVATDLDPAEVDYIVYAPNGPLQDFRPYTRAKAVLNLWAGVEDVVDNPTLTIPLCRMVDAGLKQGMVEWVLAHVLRHHLGIDDHIVNPGAAWVPRDPPLARDRTVAVLGLGELGRACCGALAALNFRVRGWSRSARDVPGTACFSGAEGLDAALTGAEIVVLLLPDTPATENTLNARTLALLAPGAAVLNPGRGPLIDDDALLAALDSGHLGHATLDTFRLEPLPKDHPFWAHPGVTVTPHIASGTRPGTASEVIAENIRRGEAGEPFLFVVDRSLGY